MTLRTTLVAFLVAAAPIAAAGQAAAAPSPATWRVGEPVLVSWTGSWYPARILQARDGKYLIRYDGYDASWDEWVTPARMKAAPGAASKPAAPAKPATPASGVGAKSPAGRYVCQTFVSGQLNNVGEFVLAANGTYQDRWNKGSGRYTYDARTARIRFTSGPQKNDRAVVTFDPSAGRGKRGWVQFVYAGGSRLHCYR